MVLIDGLFVAIDKDDARYHLYNNVRVLVLEVVIVNGVDLYAELGRVAPLYAICSTLYATSRFSSCPNELRYRCLQTVVCETDRHRIASEPLV